MIDFTGIRVVLAKKRMTQTELARKTGIRQPTISAICLGTISRLPVDVLDKICATLECQPQDLMAYVPET